MNEREQFVLLIAKNRIPKTTVATLAGVTNARVSDYVRGHNVIDENRLKIEHAIDDLVDVVCFMQAQLGLRPDLKDVPSLRVAIEEVKVARQRAELQMAAF
jgi:predicted transcriptional regulator